MHNNKHPDILCHVVWHTVTPPIHIHHMHDDKGCAVPYDTVARTVIKASCLNQASTHTVHSTS
jgi:hypothetical protein